MTPIAVVARKMRRALRNETGFCLTNEEIRALAVAGVLDLVTKAENEELLAITEAKPPLQSPPNGSFETGGAMPLDKRAIRALVAGKVLR